jgi:rhodanese-related sulfurtransferase
MTIRIGPSTLDAWLYDGDELALFDVREKGQIGEGQLFWSVPLPYSRLEIDLPRLAPNRQVRIVLLDDGYGLAALAAKRAAGLGYRDVALLDGGVPAWAAAGGALFKGVNVPSKAFGEFVEHRLGTPSISAVELARRLADGDKLAVVDGRPVDEYRKMSIPGSRCCPNGELPFRIGRMVPDPETTIVINCAGRTRSILGTEILRNSGILNPVLALENGTMGWQLAGQTLETGADRVFAEGIDGPALEDLKKRARDLALKAGVHWLSAGQAVSWLDDAKRSTFLLDVRTAEDYAAGHPPRAQNAPGGQLLQATDHFVGVRKARLLLIDDAGERAPIIAAWLARAGWTTAVLGDGRAAWAALPPLREAPAAPTAPDLLCLHSRDLSRLPPETLILDLRPSLTFRQKHIVGARWSIRPRLHYPLLGHGRGTPIVLVASDPSIARLAAIDIVEAGFSPPLLLSDPPDGWAEGGLATESTADEPAGGEAIDHLFFVHDRHNGNLAAARQYLDWEIGLVEQLDPRDRDWLSAGLDSR